DRPRLPRLERRRVGGRVRRLHPDDPHPAAQLRLELPERRGDPRDEPAAADRHDDVGHIRHLLEDLEGEPALTGHDIRVVERRDDDRARALGELGRRLQRLVDDMAVQHDVGPVVARGLQLRQRHTDRHEDRRADAQLARRERDPLGVVSGRRRDDAAGPLLLTQAREPVVGTAHLVRARALQVLCLELHGHPEQLGQEARRLHGGHHGDLRRALPRGTDLAERRARQLGHRVRPLVEGMTSATDGWGFVRQSPRAMYTMIELSVATSGTAKRAPAMPARKPPAATAMTTARGCTLTALPTRKGCSTWPPSCCTPITMSSMTKAGHGPRKTRATNTAIAPETTAPTTGMNEPRNTTIAIGTTSGNPP